MSLGMGETEALVTWQYGRRLLIRPSPGMLESPSAGGEKQVGVGNGVGRASIWQKDWTPSSPSGCAGVPVPRGGQVRCLVFQRRPP